MASSKSIEDFIAGVRPLMGEIIAFELIERGVQPAQGINGKRTQLAREFFEEYYGKQPQFYQYVATLENFRLCSNLINKIERDVTSSFRTLESIEMAHANLHILASRLRRVKLNSIEEEDKQNELLNKIDTLVAIPFVPPPVVPSSTQSQSHAIIIEQDTNQARQGVPPGEVRANRTNNNVQFTQQFQSTPQNNTDVDRDVIEGMSNINLNTRSHHEPGNTGAGAGVYTHSMFNIFESNGNYTPPMDSQQSQGVPPRTNFQQNQRVMPQRVHENPPYNFQQPHNLAYDPFSQHSAYVNPPHLEESDPFRQQSVSNNIIPAQTANQTFRFKQIPIYKWNLKFSGEGKTKDVFVFLQSIKSKARSQNVSDMELFTFASEFFSGFASTWYHSQQFNSWDDITIKLISDFVQVDYFDNLLDTIRQRKQSQSENVVQFFINFEDSCSRLPTPLSNLEKVNILRKNVLQKYRPYIALSTFQSVDEMKHALKILESTMIFTDSSKNVRFGSKDRNHSAYTDNRNNSDKNTSRSRYERFHSNDAKNNNDSSANTRFRHRSNSNASNSSHRSVTPSSNFRPPTPLHMNKQGPNSRDNSRERSRDNSRNKIRDGNLN